MVRAVALPTITDDSALGGAVIERSLRFNRSDSAYLSRALGSPTSDTKASVSVWLKRTAVSTDNSFFDNYQGTNDRLTISLVSSTDGDALGVYQRDSSGIVCNLLTTQKFRDPSSWYHILVAFDTTQGTAADRVKIYVNGTQVTSFSSSTYFSQNHNLRAGSGYTTNVGRYGAGSNYFGGYLAEFNYIDGQQVSPTDVGFTDGQTGIWMPRRYEETYGNNGFRLAFDDNSSTSALGIDSSPNGNDLTPNNFSVTAGTGNDSLEDTPSNNFCTLNSVNGDSNTALSEGNLKAVGSTSTNYSFFTRGTIAQSSGKWYYEVEYVSNAGGTNSHLPAIGWARTTLRATDNVTVSGGLCYRPAATDYIDLNGSDTSNDKPATSTGNVIQVAIDLDAGKIWFGNGGTFFESGNPSTGANANITFTGGAETLTPFVRSLSSTFIFNFGQRAFSYTPPTGYKTLCTKNLPVTSPAIISPQKFFNIVLYTGDDASSQSITGVGFQPDWIWVKRRSHSSNHFLVDVVRGATKYLDSSATDTETTDNTVVKSLDKDGFTVGGYDGINGGSKTFVAWCWKAGGTAVTNNDGSGTSQVSVNDTAGFSIVSYTGNSTGSGVTQTIGHGLGVTPELIIFKSRSFSSGDAHFATYHHEVTDASTDYMVLDTTEARVQTDTAYMNQTLPTSTVFSLGYNFTTNKSGETYIAYCFKSIPGYSKFGKYTGNENSEGPFVDCGFRPAWVLVKGESFAGNWNLFDNKRPGINVTNDRLFPNLTDAETDGSPTNNQIDILSNGFKLRGSNVDTNSSGDTYIYIAFADQQRQTPFDTFPNAR